MCAFLVLVPAFTYAQAKNVYLSNEFIKELLCVLIVRRPLIPGKGLGVLSGGEDGGAQV